MVFTPLIVNCILIGALLFWYLRKHDLLSTGTIVISLYTLSAICSLLIYKDITFLRSLTYSTYASVFFFVALVIYLRPIYYNERVIVNRFSTTGYDYKYLTYLYILAAIIETIVLVAKVRVMDFTDLLSAYYMAGEDALADNLYDNAFEGVVFNIVSYLRLPAIIIFFDSLTKRDVSKGRKVLLLMAIVVPNVLYSIRIVSRAKLVLLFVSFILCYILFIDRMSLRIKTIVNWFLIISTSFVVFLFLVITIGRFDEDANSSLLYYFGHPLLIYNGATVTPSDGNMGGAIYFDWFYDKLGISRISDADDVIGTNAGASFKTFLGSRYMDFGSIGTLLYGLIISSIILKLIRKKRITVAELYVYLFYINWLIIGVFYDSAKAISWLMVIIIYLFIQSPLFKIKTFK